MKGILTIKDRILLFPLWIMTLFPLRILYVLSDFLFLLVYYVIPYRREIVLRNLSRSFPEKNQKEIKGIAFKFYRYLCDYFIESIYLLNMSVAECNKRYVFHNLELIRELGEQNKNIIIATSHYGNWEWAANLNSLIPHHFMGIYKRLSNSTFDRLFVYLRGRYGSTPVLMKQTLRTILKSKEKGELIALYSLGDQRPDGKDLSYWTLFLNQQAPVITGTEKLARKFGFAVVFLNVKRIKRGVYHVGFELISDKPDDRPLYDITETYIQKVEKMIKEKPEFWLWSHNRWKFSPEKFKPKAAINGQ